VVREINKSGIKKINKLKRQNPGALLIRAHGAPIKTFVKAKEFGYEIIDATCPMVKEIHSIVKDMQNKGYKIIIIGDKKHEEVFGIAGQLRKKAIVIDDLSDIVPVKIGNIEKACVIAQSTQNLEKVLKIVNALKKYVPDLEFFNTICRPTREKQKEIRDLPLKNDAMIIIGSKKSANTKRLYEISRSLNKNSHWVNSKKEINPRWFKGAKSIGITAGASTPKYTIKDIAGYIRSIPN
jgi:4-hydroxy-3-methylbut-2-enyl diphosphate reductase